MQRKKQLIQQAVAQEVLDIIKTRAHPKIDPKIEAVWVFSGPGTYFHALKAGEKPWESWMDRKRILYGVAIVRAVTAKRLAKQSSEVTKEDIDRSGPYFLYNGIPKENDALRLALTAPDSFLPKEKVIIIDSVHELNGNTHAIYQTLDQVKSIPSELFGKNGMFKRCIALVSHAEHFPRILRYLEKYRPISESIRIELFPLVLPENFHDVALAEEEEKVWEYFKKGDLSWNPFPRTE